MLNKHTQHPHPLQLLPGTAADDFFPSLPLAVSPTHHCLSSRNCPDSFAGLVLPAPSCGSWSFPSWQWSSLPPTYMYEPSTLSCRGCGDSEACGTLAWSLGLKCPPSVLSLQRVTGCGSGDGEWNKGLGHAQRTNGLSGTDPLHTRSLAVLSGVLW